MKKWVITGSVVLALVILTLGVGLIFYQNPLYILKQGVKVERIQPNRDKDKDGILDLDDIVLGARKEVQNKTKYRSEYYIGGYPPVSEGVCTDVVWRALKNAGYDLKSAIDNDIRGNTDIYSGVLNIPDPNIDFRRVKNQFIFFKRKAKSLTKEVVPYDVKNLIQWQGGDIVVLKNGDHVAVISDKRRKDGVPYVIHNSSTVPMETNSLLYWAKQGRIIGHFRYTSNS